MKINRVQTGLRIAENSYNKARYICAKEQRSLNNLIEYALQRYIDQYERENGAIPDDCYE